MKSQKKKLGGGGLGWGGVRVDVNEELKFLRKLKNIFFFFLVGVGSGGGSGWGGQGRCEQRSEVFVKKKMWGGGSGRWGWGGGGQGGCERRIELFVKIQKKKNFFFFGGGGGGGGGGGVGSGSG